MPQGETLNRRRVLTGAFALIFAIGTTTGCDGEDAPVKAIAFVVDPTTTHASQQYAGALRELLGACVGLDAPVALFRVADERDDAVLLLWEGRVNRQSLESAGSRAERPNPAEGGFSSSSRT